MFKKQNRLAKTKDIQKTIKSGRVFFNSNLNLKVLLGKSLTPRFTVVVGVKVSKKAVTRNRMKRILREEIKKHLNVWPAGDYMVFVKPNAAKVPEVVLLKSLETVFGQFNATRK